MDESFRPKERITKKKEFITLYKKGKRFRGKFFTLIYLSNEFDYSRMAVVVSKKVGNAVTRNRIKRRIRYLFRTHKNLISKTHDLVFVTHKEIADASMNDLRTEYNTAIQILI